MAAVLMEHRLTPMGRVAREIPHLLAQAKATTVAPPILILLLIPMAAAVVAQVLLAGMPLILVVEMVETELHLQLAAHLLLTLVVEAVEQKAVEEPQELEVLAVVVMDRPAELELLAQPTQAVVVVEHQEQAAQAAPVS